MTGHGVPLRPWQERALRWALDTPGHRLIQAPPGAGKSRLGYEVAAHWLAAGSANRVLWAAPSVALVDQAHVAACRYVRTPAFAQLSGVQAPPGCRFIITTHSSAARFLANASERDLLIFDEAHHANTDALTNFATAQKPPQCLGLSASPWSVGLAQAFPARWVYSLTEALQDGSLVPLRVLEQMPSTRKPLTLHFVYRVQEARQKARDCGGISFVAGDSLDVLKPWLSGRVADLFACARLGEGYDVPECARVLVHRRTHSEIWAYQAVGRALRPRPGKRHGEAFCVHEETAAALARALTWADTGPPADRAALGMYAALGG